MKLLKHNHLATITFIVSAAALIGLFLSSLAGLYIARVLSKADYGRMTYFANWLPALLLVLGFGLSAKVIKDVAELRASEPSAELSRRFYTLLGLRLVTLTPLPIGGLCVWLVTQQLPYLLVALAAVCAVIHDFLLGI